MAIKEVVDKVPRYNPSPEMQKLGGGINELKSHLSDEILDHLSPDELIKILTNVSTRIHTVTSNLLIYPEIVANVLFGYWMLVSTLQADV